MKKINGENLRSKFSPLYFLETFSFFAIVFSLWYNIDMKVIITGGGSGGHFYPLVAVADKVREIAEDKKIIQPKIYYFADVPYDEDILFRQEIEFVKTFSGKLRRGAGIKGFFQNIGSVFKIAWGIADAFVKVFQITPDAIFTNGGYIAFPVLVVARILKIPVIIHVSDTVPSRVLLYAGKFAAKISIAFPEAGEYFKNKDRVALLGNPIRDGIKKKQLEGAYEYFKFDPKLPTIFVLGGSQGSQIINDTLLHTLTELLKKYQIIHQTGKNNYDDIYGRAGVVLLNNKDKHRYKIFPYLDDYKMKLAAGVADLAIARAGAGTIYEIANWGLPSILIPISKKVSRDQESNAFSYARHGAATVIRQKNLTRSVLIHEIDTIFSDLEDLKKMSGAAKEFFKPDADKKIALLITNIMLEHEI